MSSSQYICRDLSYGKKNTTVCFYIKDVLESEKKISNKKLFVSWHPTECSDETLEIIKAVYEDEIEHEEEIDDKHLLHWKNCVINKEDIIQPNSKDDEDNKQDEKEHDEDNKQDEKETKKLLKEIEDEIKLNIRGHLQDIDEETFVEEAKKWNRKLSKDIKKCALDMYNDYKNGELEIPDLRKREGDVVREYMEDVIYPKLPKIDDDDSSVSGTGKGGRGQRD
jgi:hypothetical protein